jgi:hypothetical protein
MGNRTGIHPRAEVGMRIRCKLFGCVQDGDLPVCARCNEHVYEGDFIGIGQSITFPIRRLWWVVRSIGLPRCAHCRRVLFRWPNVSQPIFCNDECFKAWVPF